MILKRLRRKLYPSTAAVVAACQTKVTLPQRAWQRVKTRALSVLQLTPSPHLQMGVCLWMEIAEAGEKDFWDQSGTIPVTVMRDVPPGDQDAGRKKIQNSLREMMHCSYGLMGCK